MTTLLAAIVLIGVLITVHEFGHFIVAKMCGVKVEVFSVGFGSPIVEVQRGETVYRIAWIPFGGYVRMLGQDPDGEVAEADKGRSLPEKSAFERILIYAAGPAMNIILPFFIVVPLVGLSEQFDEVHSSEVGAIDHSMPAYQAGLRAGDIISDIDGSPVYAFWQIKSAIDGYQPDGDPLRFTVTRQQKTHTFDVHPKAVRHTDQLLKQTTTTYVIGYQPDMLDAQVAIIDPEGTAARSGIRSFDTVVSIDGQPVSGFLDIARRYDALKTGDTAQVVVSRLGAVLVDELDLLRENQRVKLTLTKESGHSLGIQHAGTCITSVDPDSPAGRLLEPGDCLVSVDGHQQSLGAFLLRRLNTHPEKAKALTWVRNGEVMTGTLQRVATTRQDPAMASELTLYPLGFSLPLYSMVPTPKVSNIDRFGYAWHEAKTRFASQTSQILRALGGMFTGAVSPSQLSGPLTIFQLAGRAAREGIDVYLNLMVLLSLSIGLFNLLPIPLLDGGHILFAMAELISRRPMPESVLQTFQSLGVMLILALFVFALGNDAIRTWKWSKPKSDVTVDRVTNMLGSAYRGDMEAFLSFVTPESRAMLVTSLQMPGDSMDSGIAAKMERFLGFGYELRPSKATQLVDGADSPNERTVLAQVGGRDLLFTLRQLEGRWLVDLTSIKSFQ